MARPVRVLVTDGTVKVELAAASPLGRAGVGCGSVVDAGSASAAHGDNLSTCTTRCLLLVASCCTTAVMDVRKDKIVQGPTYWLNSLRCLWRMRGWSQYN